MVVQLTPMPRLLSPLLLLSLLCLITINGESSMHFQLIRKRPNAAKTHLQQYIIDIVNNDHLRAAMIGERIGHRRTAELAGGGGDNRTFAMPISSGAYTGTGQYFVRFRVGTPTQEFLLVADTGSDLTWMKCRYGRRRRDGGDSRRRVFRADESSSFRPIRCSSQLCKNSLPFSLTRCPTPASPCAYDYRYADGSMTQGIFADESANVTLSNGQSTQLKEIIVGCTSSSVGSSFRASDGVLGLGYSPTSFAARTATRFGGKFSYCLVDHLSPENATGHLVFGGGDAAVHRPSPGGARRRYAELLLDPRLEPFYSVRVAGISVGGEMLNISRDVWNAGKGGGAIVDSGTSLTLLAEPAYRAVVAALSLPLLRRYKRVQVKPFEYCFEWKKGAASGGKPAVPRLAVHLVGAGAGGELARLEPPVKSYLIDVADGVKCLGLLSSSWPGVSTIGNILQQNHIWEFDLVQKKLGFEPSTCT